jgi:hypothetical protein
MTDLTPPPFVRDPLNWEGRVREEWTRQLRVPFFLIETAPGYVQVSTDVLRDLLTDARYHKTGDI